MAKTIPMKLRLHETGNPLTKRLSLSFKTSLHQQRFDFLCVSLQVAHLPAAAHPGPDHLPAGLSGAGQAVPLAAHYVSLIHSVNLSYLHFSHKEKSQCFGLMGDLFFSV